MPVVYRVKHDGTEERTATFFAKKGEATKFRRDNKKELNPDDAEALKINGRDSLCALLNDPYSWDPDGTPDESLEENDEENEFI